MKKCWRRAGVAGEWSGAGREAEDEGGSVMARFALLHRSHYIGRQRLMSRSPP